MKIENVDMIFFSPTGSTKKVLLEVARGIGAQQQKLMDLTLKSIRELHLFELEGDIVILGFPVYGKRIFKSLREVFTRMNLNNKFVILVLIYGNIDHGFAHYELAEICNRKSAKILGIGFFVGEHTYSTAEIPIANNRPNQKDLLSIENYASTADCA